MGLAEFSNKNNSDFDISPGSEVLHPIELEFRNVGFE